MTNTETLQDKLQTEKRKDNRMRRVVTSGAVFVIILACLGMGWQKLVEWSDAEGESALATAAVVETRQAIETATAVANAPMPGYADPAEIVKLSLEQRYNVDYTVEFDNWAEKLCKYTTKHACEKEVYNIGGENWKNNIVPDKRQYTSVVTPIRMIWEHSYYDEDAGRILDAQVWEYQIMVSDRPGQVYTRYVMIGNEGAGWLMIHDLWDNEAEQLLAEIAEKAEPNT
jgi:hypothetical protein